MKHSGIIIYFIIISTFCFFTTSTALCLSCPFWASPTTNSLHGRLPRKALLSTHFTQHEREAIKVLDASKRLLIQKAYRSEKTMNGSNEEEDDEQIYHIDYHGVTTHPGPNPKHGRP
ncbi:Cysteine--tRNA ligase [Bienertia sinuspersici]